MNKKLLTGLLILVLLVPLGVGLAREAGAPPLKVVTSGTIPTFTIIAVEKDKSVTIQTNNFPPNDKFVVTMGLIGTRGIGGIKVADTFSGTGGSFVRKYDIPDALKGQYQIAIRLESPLSGYYAYNWFYNNDTEGDGGSPVTPAPGYSGYPTFSIDSVERDKNVTINIVNLPPNDTFKVRMNWMGTRGVGGEVVATFDSGAGGAMSKTFDIPAFLKGQYQIAIRIESPTSGYYAFNWFYNNDTDGNGGSPVTPAPGYSGYPTFSIAAVKQDKNVTINIVNLPPNDTFKVRMNWMGTRGVGGEVVATFDSGAGGAMSKTFDIPAFLKGEHKIAIRIESPTSGYYAYNWFYNNDAP